MRNKQLLTDRENERTFVDIIENVVEPFMPIQIRYNSKPRSYVETFGDAYHVITLGRIKGVDKFTALNHEAGHILFNSPTQSAEDMIDEWVKEWKDKKYVDLIKRTYWYALNLIEDQRIESNMAKLYINNKRRFYKAKLNVGRGHEFNYLCTKPLHVLACIRFLRGDLVRESKYYNMAKEILNEVEGTGQKGALIGLVKYKSYLDEYINNMLEHPTKLYPNEVDWKEEVDHDTLDYKEVGTVDTSNIEHDTFADAWYDGEEQVQKLLKKLSGPILTDTIITHNMIEDDGDICIGNGKPMKEIADGMNKIFRKLCEMPKETIGYDGDEMDIESYITNKADKDDTGKCFIDTKYVNGISILVSVDGSGSMEDGGYSSMSYARDMVATLYKAIESINNIDLRAVVWSANLMGVMNVTTIKSMEDTRKIRTAGDYPTTPTHMAIEYSTKMIKRMKGRKKLLIFITDGSPEYMKNGMFIPPATLVKMSSNAMMRGLRRCDNIMAILIKPSDYSKKCCSDVFGNRLMVVDNMKAGSDIIMNKFKRLVMGVLK